MKIRAYRPCSALQQFVKCYKIIESDPETVNRVLPDTSIAIAFRFKGNVSYIEDNVKQDLSPVTISGLRNSVRLIKYAPASGVLIVLFKYAGITAFFKEPSHELFEKSIALNYFDNNLCLDVVTEQLSAAENDVEKIKIVERFLLSTLKHTKQDGLIEAAIAKIKANYGLVNISKLSGSFYLSNDAFEKRFRKQTGATPKQFASIVRLNHLISNKENTRSIFDILCDGEFYDQSHFTKKFRQFTGQTPKVFFASPVFW